MSSLPLPVSPAPFPSLDNTLGAWLLGTCFGLIMQGMIYHQAYQYYRLYPNDRIILKLWVVVVVFIETVNSALTIHTSYVYLITNYSNPASLLGPPVWSLSILPIPASFAALVSQTFFARRVYLFGPRRGRIAVVTAAMTCYLGFFGIFAALSVRTFHTNDFQEFLKFSWMASVGSSLLMVGDFMTTAVLIFTLRRSRTGVTRTDSLLDLLIMYAISTGLLICIFNILNVAFAIAEPDNLIYTAISMVLAKLYANTFLVASVFLPQKLPRFL
ncbi:hypothetical protein C8Q79DRAFT_18240 [Trametes meyenii]|nr:hypothetical protein C8Q79DRAFT_18240 [Trametes meyenii]